jgi:hypothetical protein
MSEFNLYNSGIGWSNWTEVLKTGDASITDGISSVTITATQDSSQTLHRFGVFNATNWDYLKATIIIHDVETSFSIDLEGVSGNHKAGISTLCESDYGFQNIVGLTLYTEGNSRVDSDDNYESETTTDVEITRVWLEGYSTGWVSPGTVVSDDSVGAIAWSNPSNATASDNSYAKATVSSSASFMVTDSIVKLVDETGDIVGDNKSADTALESSDTYRVYGADDDLWNETWSASDINDSDFGIVFQGAFNTIYTEYIKATNFDFDIPSGATIDGIEARIEQKYVYIPSSGSPPSPIQWVIDIDHIQIRVYYTELSTPTVGTKYALPAFKRP